MLQVFNVPKSIPPHVTFPPQVSPVSHPPPQTYSFGRYKIILFYIAYYNKITSGIIQKIVKQNKLCKIVITHHGVIKVIGWTVLSCKTVKQIYWAVEEDPIYLIYLYLLHVLHVLITAEGLFFLKLWLFFQLIRIFPFLLLQGRLRFLQERSISGMSKEHVGKWCSPSGLSSSSFWIYFYNMVVIFPNHTFCFRLL